MNQIDRLMKGRRLRQGCSQLESHGRQVMLRKGPIEKRTEGASQVLSPAVLRDADHLNRMRRVVSGREVPADRILIRPVPPGHFFVHDSHVL